MILVDKDIKDRVSAGELIIEEYQEDNLNGISYDLTLKVVCDEQGKEHESYNLEPGEVVFIKTKEKLKIPENILGRIAEKNSRMRQGLRVDGPHYQPGHITFAFLRVQNISANVIVLKEGMNIAQIIFEQLTQVPQTPYNLQSNASFQREERYLGLGNYTEEYGKQTQRKVEKAKEDIETMSQRIYANVLTIMGVLVAVFSLLTINYQAFANAALDFKYIIMMNLTLALSITLLMGIIMVFVNNARNRWFLVMYLVILSVLALACFIIA